MSTDLFVEPCLHFFCGPRTLAEDAPTALVAASPQPLTHCHVATGFLIVTLPLPPHLSSCCHSRSLIIALPPLQSLPYHHVATTTVTSSLLHRHHHTVSQ